VTGPALAGTPIDQAAAWRDWALAYEGPGAPEVYDAGVELHLALTSDSWAASGESCAAWGTSWTVNGQASFSLLCGGWWEGVELALDNLARVLGLLDDPAGEAVAATADGVANQAATADDVVGEPGDWFAETPTLLKIGGLAVVALLLGRMLR